MYMWCSFHEFVDWRKTSNLAGWFHSSEWKAFLGNLVYLSFCVSQYNQLKVFFFLFFLFEKQSTTLEWKLWTNIHKRTHQEDGDLEMNWWPWELQFKPCVIKILSDGHRFGELILHFICFLWIWWNVAQPLYIYFTKDINIASGWAIS